MIQNLLVGFSIWKTKKNKSDWWDFSSFAWFSFTLTLNAKMSPSLPTRVLLNSIKLISHWMLRISILIAWLNSDYVIDLSCVMTRLSPMMFVSVVSYAADKLNYSRRLCNSMHWCSRWISHNHSTTIGNTHLGEPLIWNTIWTECAEKFSACEWIAFVGALELRLMNLTWFACYLRWSLHLSMCFLVDCISNPYLLSQSQHEKENK